MFSRAIVSAFAAAGLAAAQVPDEDGRYTISTPDIKAQFIPYGATLTNLFVKDKNGDEVDVVLGYDDVEFYREKPCDVPYPPPVSNMHPQPRTLLTQSTTPFPAAT
jgi:aldose 1-epimerase